MATPPRSPPPGVVPTPSGHPVFSPLTPPLDVHRVLLWCLHLPPALLSSSSLPAAVSGRCLGTSVCVKRHGRGWGGTGLDHLWTAAGSSGVRPMACGRGESAPVCGAGNSVYREDRLCLWEGLLGTPGRPSSEGPAAQCVSPGLLLCGVIPG